MNGDDIVEKYTYNYKESMKGMCKECIVSNIKIVVSRTPVDLSDSSGSDGEDEIRYQK